MVALSRLAPIGALVLAMLVVACGSSPQPRATTDARPALRSLSETRALELIDGWLTEAAWIGRPGWVVELTKGAHLEVDLRLGDSQYGIEWVSADDREHYGSALPPPAPEGQLRLFNAPGGAQILILDHEVYRSPRESTLDRTLVLSDAEMKLRRDVMDFVAYVGAQ